MEYSSIECRTRAPANLQQGLKACSVRRHVVILFSRLDGSLPGRPTPASSRHLQHFLRSRSQAPGWQAGCVAQIQVQPNHQVFQGLPAWIRGAGAQDAAITCEAVAGEADAIAPAVVPALQSRTNRASVDHDCIPTQLHHFLASLSLPSTGSHPHLHCKGSPLTRIPATQRPPTLAKLLHTTVACGDSHVGRVPVEWVTIHGHVECAIVNARRIWCVGVEAILYKCVHLGRAVCVQHCDTFGRRAQVSI